MILLDGRKLREKKFTNLKDRVNKIKEKSITPRLAVILIGNDPASEIYVGHKIKACDELGIKSKVIRFEDSVSRTELEKEIQSLNNNNDIHGILVQFPLPDQLSKREVARLISPQKDVDGVHPRNQGILLMNHWKYTPISCTPYGIMELFKEYDISLDNKKILILGRSSIVGKPLSYLLSNSDATVSVVHSKTPKSIINTLVQTSDIIVSATGSKKVFDENLMKNGVVVVDVGIHKDSQGRLSGDLDHSIVVKKASYLTPVPGGVGPMTIAMLMENLVRLIEVTIVEKIWDKNLDLWHTLSK